MKLLRKLYKEVIKQKNPDKIIFIDETGIDISMTRYYGRASTNERVYDSVPYKEGKRKNIIGAMSNKGMLASLVTEDTINGDVFLNYIEYILFPELLPGDIVVMDNLPVHKVDGVRELIESIGAELLYLPPYSPDFSPIELSWSKIKTFLRKTKSRTSDALEEGICKAYEQILAKNCEGWFRHCRFS